MKFDEWMEVSEEYLGREFMEGFNQFCLGNISFDEWVDQAYNSMLEENKIALYSLVETVGKSKGE